MAPRLQKSSPGDSEPIDVEFREVSPTEAPRASSPASRLVPVPVSVPARARLLKQKPAAATVRAACPVCGRVSDLADLSLGFMTARVCPRCAGFGHLGMLLLKRML
jgi:hypothetical protein